ncbi:acyltransferase family protein [Candidatus Clostridium radicumherbarum]|uniref:Acyltransferase family protein n=1 Tax=Candidatus Clostridium radicumherbarum TaxID=3381662 RepID=A0ABW8TU89_9CLOT
MNNILKSIKLDHNIMKSRYPMFAIDIIGVLFAFLTKVPIYGALIIMVVSTPITGQYFNIYEKDNLEKLYGILPLRKSEVVIGRYLYALCIIVLNGIIAAIVAFSVSIFTNKGMNGLEVLTYISVGFLYACLMTAVIFPLYFKFSFSKVYIFSNLPFYLIFVLLFVLTRKTNVLQQTGQNLTSNLGMIVTIGFCLGLILLSLSCILSCALTEGNHAVSLTVEEPGKRLYFVDNLRTWMVVLVVLQHIAEINNTLYLFMMLNQAYFMGLLFLLSGYFTPGSYERKGPSQFLKDRLLRLGVPTLIYAFILSPISRISTHMQQALAGDLTGSLFSMGPMWFVVMLLIFDLGYLAWKRIANKKSEHPTALNRQTLTLGTVTIFMVALAVVSYLIRFLIPYGTFVIGFPSLGYLPQYLSFFLIGMVAFKRDWLRSIQGSLGQLGFVFAVLATIILFPVAIIGGGSAFIGHGSWQSAVFALWDSIFAVGMSMALITFFRRFVNGGKKFGQFLSQHSFTVYLIHVPIIVFLILAMRGLQMLPQLKFCLAAIVGLPLCFGAAYLIRLIPYAKKVI